MKVKSIKTGFLQDTRSWILFPKSVLFFGSLDGIKFSQIAVLQHNIPDSSYTIQRKDFYQILEPQNYRFIKIKGINYGKLPLWHQGKNEDAFIFIDEITIE